MFKLLKIVEERV